MKRNLVAVIAAMLVGLLVAPTAVWASHRFDDVSDDNTFHEDIDAVADAGVTQGCDADSYCPDDPVSRQQMAGFLNRLGALDPDEDPVVDARTVQGLGMFADIITVDVMNAEKNNEECVPTSSLRGPQHEFGTFFITYQLLDVPEAVDFFTFDVNVAARAADTGEVPQPGEFLLCFATLDGRELPEGAYRLFAVEAHQLPPVTD